MTWPPTTHQDIEDDLTNGHGWAGTLIERFEFGEQPLPGSFLWTPGRFYSSAVNSAGSSPTGPSANSLVLTPIYFPIARPVDQIAVNVTTAGAAGTIARLGIYNSDPSTGMPTTVKVDAGTVAVDSIGAKVLSVSASLWGLHWLACTAQGGTFTGLPVAGLPVVGGIGGISAGSPYTQLQKPAMGAIAPLPDLTGQSMSQAAATAVRVGVRAA